MRNLIFIIVLLAALPGCAQQPAPADDKHVASLKALLALKAQAVFGKELLKNKERAKQAAFLTALADKDALLAQREKAARPNYGGNAANRHSGTHAWEDFAKGEVPVPEPSK